jgi:6-phosphogluconolactonase
MTPSLTIVDTADFVETAAQQLAHILGEAARRSARVSLALSGGETPRPVYARLATIPGVPWKALEIFFADERAVPPDDPASNYRMVRESLIDALAGKPYAVHRMPADRGDLDAAAGEYQRLLPPALDVLVLGIGEDGHTASLFPGQPTLLSSPRLVLAVEGPKPPARRLTLTPPVIRSARCRLVFATGAGKAIAVARALEGPYDPVSCPAQLARDGVWIIDRPAGGDLTRSGA